MARTYADECERNVVRDCDNLFVVLKNLNVPSPRNDAESLKYLYKLNMMISYKQTAKLFPITQFSIKYICHHPILPTILTEIIKNSRNLKITTYSIEVLFRLITKNKLVGENERKSIRKLFWDAQNFKNVLECVQSIYFIYKDDTPNFLEILIKVIKIINCCYMKKGISQQSLLTNFDVNFIADLICDYDSRKDLFQSLLPLIKVLSKNKKFVNNLATDQFFNSLCLLIPTLNKTTTIISILKLMTKTPEAIESMSRSEKIYAFILAALNTSTEKTIVKKHLMGILYKITKTTRGYEIISKPIFWNSLLEFVSKNDKQEELKMRLILIRGYTILHRGINQIHYQIKPVDFNLKLSKALNKNLNLDNSDESDDNEESDEEDAYYSLKSVDKVYTSEEDCDLMDSEIDDISSEIETQEQTYFEENKKDLSSANFMRKYFEELLGSGCEKGSAIKIFETKEDVNEIVNRINRCQQMNQVAFPDLFGTEDEVEEYIDPSINHFASGQLIRKLKKSKYFGDTYQKKIVYDLDSLLQMNCDKVDIPNMQTFQNEVKKNEFNAINVDAVYKAVPYKPPLTLRFESRFESGNLRKVEQIGDSEYNLFLTPDVNTRGGLQWFYFQICHMQSDIKYTFNIINFQKANSQFNYGMQPVFFSCLDFILHGIGWRKFGNEIVYYGNEYRNSDDKQFRTLSFCLHFPHKNDYCYLAYHYPYTYTRLMTTIRPFTMINNGIIYSRVDKLCSTVNGGNDVPLITITASKNMENSLFPIEERPLVFITARVHPGESNSSWITDGIVQFLLDETDAAASAAREKYVFKIIPMLNPEGVIFGNSRSGLAGEDLNRCWRRPGEARHPEVFAAKELVRFAREALPNEPFAFVDVHGHSRKKFFFLYGCSAKQSWSEGDRERHEDGAHLLLPKLLSANPHMKSSFCRYTIERKRESTCRVVMWREFNIKRSYTLECSYCSGENKKKITTKILRDIGVSIITSLASLPRRSEGK